MTIDEFLERIEEKQLPAPPESIATFEGTLGASLPEDYRRFLVACNGGYIGGSLWFRDPATGGGMTEAGVDHIGGIREEWQFSLEAHRDCYFGRIPEVLTWIMDDPFGNAICIGLIGSHRGKIYFWDHEGEPDEDWDGEVETAGNLTLLAGSFTMFVAGLRATDVGQTDANLG